MVVSLVSDCVLYSGVENGITLESGNGRHLEILSSIYPHSSQQNATKFGTGMACNASLIPTKFCFDRV